jgi:hypothetical protein
MPLRCKGERQAYAVGVGSASYGSGFKLDLQSWLARRAAASAAEDALQANLLAVKEAVCKDLCEAGCSCSIRLERVNYFSGEERFTFVAKSTFLGFSWGGNWTAKKEYRVIGECWREVIHAPEDIAPVAGISITGPP